MKQFAVRVCQRLALIVPCLLVCASAQADTQSFRLPVHIEDRTLGVWSGQLTLSATGDDQIQWTLSDSTFRATEFEEAKVVVDVSTITGTGQAPKAARLSIREIKVTLEQDTAVDVSYRFRMMAEADGDTIRSISLEHIR